MLLAAGGVSSMVAAVWLLGSAVWISASLRGVCVCGEGGCCASRRRQRQTACPAASARLNSKHEMAWHQHGLAARRLHKP